jgi:hypothetical protein
MLFAAIVPAAKPCASISRDVGAEPMKLNVVVPACELENAAHGLIVYVVDALSAEVAPVAVIVLDPALVSATVIDPALRKTHDPEPVMVVPPRVAPVVHAAGREAVVNAVEVKVTDSAEPKPVAAIVTPVIVCCGKPKLLLPVATLNVTAGFMVNGALTELVPSVTTMVCAPPGMAGTVTCTLKLPYAEVVRQGPVPTRLSVPVVPPIAVVNAPPHVLGVVNSVTVALLTVVDIAIGLLLANPEPVMTRDEPTVPDVTAVSTPLVIVDRATVGVAACAL